MLKYRPSVYRELVSKPVLRSVLEVRELGGLAVTSGWTITNGVSTHLLESRRRFRSFEVSTDERPNQTGGSLYS